VALESLSPTPEDWDFLILTDKGVVADDRSALAVPNSITLTRAGLLFSTDREGNDISSAPSVHDIELIEWGTIKKDLIGFTIGLTGFLMGAIGLFFLPSTVILIEVMEAGLCLLGVLLVWVSLVPGHKAYLYCKGEQRSIMFILRVPVEIAAPGILEFIAAMHAASRAMEVTQSEKSKEANSLQCA